MTLVYLSKCHPVTLFSAPQNVATSQPGHGVFACLLMAPEGLGSESPWKWWARGSGFPHENFSQLLPPEKAKFLFCLSCPPPPGGLVLSILAPKWAVLTLTSVWNIVSQSHIYTFHIKIPPQHASVQRGRCRRARRKYLRTCKDCRERIKNRQLCFRLILSLAQASVLLGLL